MLRGNTKLKNKIINKLINQSNILNDTSIDFILWLSLKQNCFGSVEGVMYDDVCLDLNICKQTFYNTIQRLEQLEFIKAEQSNKGFWRITILDNIFATKADEREGYVNTNKKFLFSKDFRTLKLNEKLLCLYLLMNPRVNNHENFNIYAKTIGEILGVTSISTIYSYLENISKFFPNVRKTGSQPEKGDKISFVKNNDTPFERTFKSERVHYLEHKIKYICRKYKISYTIKDLKDLIILIGQYSSKGIGKLSSTILEVLISNKMIIPKLINYKLAKIY